MASVQRNNYYNYLGGEKPYESEHYDRSGSRVRDLP